MPVNVLLALNGSQVCATQIYVDQESIRDLCARLQQETLPAVRDTNNPLSGQVLVNDALHVY